MSGPDVNGSSLVHQVGVADEVDHGGRAGVDPVAGAAALENLDEGAGALRVLVPEAGDLAHAAEGSLQELVTGFGELVFEGVGVLCLGASEASGVRGEIDWFDLSEGIGVCWCALSCIIAAALVGSGVSAWRSSYYLQ